MIKMVNDYGHITQVKMPVPYPLSYVNSYLVIGSSGYTLIDPGLNTEQARQAWQKVMRDLDIAFRDIKQIVVTHHHPDHYGLAGWFQANCHAPVYMSEIAYQQACIMWGEGTTINDEIVAMLLEHGMDDETAANMLPHLDSFYKMVTPQPEVTSFNLAEKFVLGDREYDLIIANGHASGQVCFYDQNHGEMFCGDQVLPDITPNVSFMPRMDSDPLTSFINSLKQLQQYDVKIAYPGHRQPLTNFAERAQYIIDHHHQRLKKIRELLAVPRTAYGVCRLLFGDRLSTHQLRFAMTETLAHLIYLEKQGKLQRFTEGEIVIFAH